MPDQSIHVSGVGLRLPPTLHDIPSLWAHLVSGERCRHRVQEGSQGERRLTEDTGLASHEGLLAEIDSFDPAPFGISDREARTMDPQQRLLLECAWESLADAGYAWDALRGEQVGIFVGAYAQDWLLTSLDAAQGSLDAAVGTGTAMTVLANRLSYLLDTRGPSLTVDTACASSLTALHLAVQSIRSGECDRALVAGASIGHHAAYRALNAGSLPLSASKSSRPFDVRADGIVRGEGVVAVLLEREGVSRGGRHGRILGSAIGHGGRTNGLTAPSGAGQAQVIRRALDSADIDPAQVRYVEAHGTGTLLGDPIEAGALHSVYGQSGRICDVGSVKGIFGHTEATAGLVGLLSALLVAQKGIVPGQGGFAVINPTVNIDGSDLNVAAETRPVADTPGELATAVSSLGFGGSIAHVVLGPPAMTSDAAPSSFERDEGLMLLASGATSEALAAQHWALLDHVRDLPDQMLADFAARQSRVAAALPQRAGWFADEPARLRQALEQNPPVSSEPRPQGQRMAFVFSGQGSSWSGMGLGLWRLPSLRDLTDRWEAEVQDLFGWSLAERLAGDVDTDTESAQVCTAAVQLAVVEILRGRGVLPSVVVGHSMGEAVAAVVAGTMSSRDAFAVLGARAEVIEGCALGGRMLSVNLPVDEVEATIAAEDGVVVGVINGPEATVVSGDRDAIERLARWWRERGVKVALLPVDYAFHGPALAGAQVHVEAVLEEPATTWVSTVTGTVMGRPDDDHWSKTVTEPVRLTTAIDTAVQISGARIIVEISPRPVLIPHLMDLLGNRTTVLASMSQGDPPSRWIPELLVRLFEAGASLDVDTLSGVCPSVGGVVPPSWQRKRYWPLGERTTETSVATPERAVSQEHHKPESQIPTARELAEFMASHIMTMIEGAEPDRILLEEPTSQWEIPSLAVVTLRNAIESTYGVIAPLPLLLQGKSPLETARLLVAGEAPSGEDLHRFESALDRIDRLSDEEAESLLAELEAAEEA